jgi:3-deoxy-D-manno-octulosonic-acid transferase
VPRGLIGGTFGPTEGHNPWEPAALGSAILHGPRVANFAADFALLDGAGAALEVTPALAHAAETDHSAMAGHAAALSRAAQRSLGPLAARPAGADGMRLFLLLWSLLWTCACRRSCSTCAVVPARTRSTGGIWPNASAAMPARHAGAVWVHAVSLGELRSAVPLIRGLLAGASVVVTAFTPAGRRAAATAFGPEIAAGRLDRRLGALRACLVLPQLLPRLPPEAGAGDGDRDLAPHGAGRARCGRTALHVQRAISLDSMAARSPAPPASRCDAPLCRGFREIAPAGRPLRRRRRANVTVTGELRFDQPIPPEQIAAAPLARRALAGDRRVLAFASMTEPEEDLFLATLSRLPGDVFTVLIPRAPERFEPVAAALAGRGLRFVRRSAALTTDLRPAGPATADILLGDSLGEMQFYLALADRVVVGGGFQPKGSHNIIEPLALGRPVIVGPHIQTIEYPAVEAIAAGVCLQTTPGALGAALDWPGPPPGAIAAFLAEHSGATARTLAALAPLLRPS